MLREPVVAGRFYPGDRRSLEAELEEIIPQDVAKIDAIGVVSPHAGYMYSGSIAGKVYGRLKQKDTYIILGPSHTGVGAKFAMSDDSWRTPMGTLRADTVFIESLLGSSGLLRVDQTGHAGEHAIEVQLPFLQKTSPESLIVPITVQCDNYVELSEVAHAIVSSVKDTEKKIMIIASSDMTHFEPRATAGVKDQMALDKILDIDPEGLLETVTRKGISMCGVLPVVLMLAVARDLGANRTELVEYSDSGEVTGDVSDVVGYAGIIVS
jgi:MEMO1 family protein